MTANVTSTLFLAVWVASISSILFLCASFLITAPLVKLIVHQNDSISNNTIRDMFSAKSTTKHLHQIAMTNSSNNIRSSLSQSDLLLFDIASEKGASSWLTVLPIKAHGFTLHKGAFRDGLCLRYGLRPPSIPDSCVCGKSFTVEHALSCFHGGFPILRHDEVRDTTASLMKPISRNLSIEPVLQPLTGESFRARSSCSSNDARLDIKSDGFWDNSHKTTYFDIRVFNPILPD